MFGRRFRILTLLQIPVYIDVSWILIAVLVTWSLAVGLFPYLEPGYQTSTYWLMGVGGALGLFVSIVVHEFSHAVVARRVGMPIRGITLFIFGGVAEMQDEPPNAGAEFRMAIAGPIASVVISIVCLAIAALLRLADGRTPVSDVFSYLGWINALLVAFNLLPAFPLDGGRVMRAGLWHWKRNLRSSTRTASHIGAGFGIGLIVLGVAGILTGNFIGGLWWILIGAFLRSAARMSYQQVLVRRALEGEPVERFMERSPTTVTPNTTVADLVDDFIYKHHYKMYPVCTNGTLLGCVTMKKIKDVPREAWHDRTVADLADKCSSTNTVAPDEDAMQAFTKMNANGESRLLVVRDGRLCGVLTLRDLLKFLSLKLELEDDADHSMMRMT